MDYGTRGKAGASLLLFSLPIVPRALFPSPQPPCNIVELKHQRWRRLRKRHLKSEIALLQTLSRLIPSCLVRQMLATSFGVEFSRTVSKFRKRIRSCCLEFPSSAKREIWHFNVVVVKRRIRNVQKSVMHVQSCGFANRNLLLFCRSRWHRRRRCLSSLQRGFPRGGRCNKVTVWSVIAPPTWPSFLGVSHWMCSRRHRLHYSAISGEKVQIEKKLCNVT